MLEINHVTKKFGTLAAVDNITLKLEKPGLYVFVGANGSGKSTLFNLISGFILPDKGEIKLGGINDSDKRRTRIGISNEPFNTESSLSIKSIVEICEVIKNTGQNSMSEWLKYWELLPFVNKDFKGLSTGMKKRLSLAVSLVGNPEYLLLDEPFNGLDPIGIDLLNKLINRLISEEKYIFLSTHLLNEIINPVNAVYLVMDKGKLIGTVHSESKNHRQQILKLLKSNHDKN